MWVNKAQPALNNMKRMSELNSSLQVRTFAEITSAHGFSFFLNSSSWFSRSAWAFLTIVCTIFSVVFTVIISKSYFQSPFFTTEISIQPINESMVTLPDLIVCDPSPWDFDKALKNNISAEQLSFITHLLYPQQEGGSSKVNTTKFQELEKGYEIILKKFDDNPIYLLNNVTKDCDQLIGYCQLGTIAQLNVTECCAQLFSFSAYTQQYKCFSSGGKMNFKMIEPAKAFGITVGVAFEDSSTKLDENVASLWALSMTGIAVAAIDPKSNLYDVAQTNMKLLAPNTCNILAVEKKETDNSDKSSDFQFHEEWK